MAHNVDIGTLISDIRSAVSTALGTEVTAVAGFSQIQLEAMAKQTAWIAEASSKGEISPELRDFFLRNLEGHVADFLKVLQGVTEAAIENAWNATVKVLWGTIAQVTAAAIPVPMFPLGVLGAFGQPSPATPSR